MRKLTVNQLNVLECLSNDFTKLNKICDKYAVIQGKKGLSDWSYVWKSEVFSVLKSLVVRDLVEYKYAGYYRLKIEENK